MFRRQLEYPALKRAVREQQRLFGATVVLIEDKASGTQSIQEDHQWVATGVTRYQPIGDKTMRLHAQKQRRKPLVKIVWAPGSMEWAAEQEKARSAAAPDPVPHTPPDID